MPVSERSRSWHSVTRQRHMRMTAWLGVLALLLAFAGPLYSQLRALDAVPLATLDADRLHCGDARQTAAEHPVAWVHQLAQCGYCDFLAGNPPLPSAPVLAVGAPAALLLRFLPPEQGQSREPLYRPQARGPPTRHV